jgi:hypothetical protein
MSSTSCVREMMGPREAVVQSVDSWLTCVDCQQSWMKTNNKTTTVLTRLMMLLMFPPRRLRSRVWLNPSARKLTLYWRCGVT